MMGLGLDAWDAEVDCADVEEVVVDEVRLDAPWPWSAPDAKRYPMTATIAIPPTMIYITFGRF
jgi:hypothetical protein